MDLFGFNSYLIHFYILFQASDGITTGAYNNLANGTSQINP